MARVADDQWDVEALVKVELLAPGVVIAAHFAVVAGENNQGVVVLACGFEVRDDAAYGIVHLVHHAVVASTHLAQLKLGHVNQVVGVVLVVVVGTVEALDPLGQVRVL